MASDQTLSEKPSSKLSADDETLHAASNSQSINENLGELELAPIKSYRSIRSTTAQDAAELEKTETHQSRRSHKSDVVETGFAHPVTDLSRNIVGWDGEDDPENPRNWTMMRKCSVLGLVSAITVISPLASTMYAPAVSLTNLEFHNTSTILSSFVVSVFVLGWAFGPLVLSPLSEIYGRRRVLDAGNFTFVVWQIGCALAPNLGSLIAFRFLAGLGGAGCLTIGGGVIADLFHPDQRGTATALYSVGPLLGPVIGPIGGSFLAANTDWRWIFWLLLILSGVVSTLIFFVNQETNHHILIARKVEQLKKETGNPNLVSWYAKDVKPRSKREILKDGLLRPSKMLFKSPIVALVSTYMATVYGVLYLLFTTIVTLVVEGYDWDPQFGGLAYLGIGLGFLIGLALVARLNDATVIRLAARNNGVMEPEMRLPTCVFFAMFLPVSLFWYGWTADKHVHWIVPIIGLMPYGIGQMGIFIPLQTYMIDAFPEHAASALATLTATRSLVGALLPMAGPKMYETLGLGWGNSLLGFIALGLAAPVYWIYRYGGAIRKSHPIDL